MSNRNESNKSRRFTLKRVLIAIGCVILIAFLWAGAWVYSVLYPQPTFHVDYAREIVELCAGRQPSGDNGWDEFARAISIFDEISGDMVAEAHARAEAEAAARRESETEDAIDVGETEEAEDEPFSFSFGVEDGDEEFIDVPWEYIRDHARVLHGEPDPERWTLEAEELDRMRERGVFDLLASALRHERFVAPPMEAPDDLNSGLMGAVIPIPLGMGREFSRAHACAMRLAMLDVNRREHERMLRQSLGIPRILALQPPAVYRMTAGSAVVFPLREIMYELYEHDWDEPYLLRIYEIIADETDWMNSAELAAESERLTCHSIIQNWFTKNLFGNGRVILSNLPDMSGGMGGLMEITERDELTIADRLENFTALTYPDRNQTEQAVDEYFDFLIAFSQRPLGQQARTHDEIIALGERLSAENQIASMILPGWRLAEGDIQIRLQRDAALAALVIEMHRARHGEYPSSLDALDHDLRERLPVDPLQPDRGEFGYALYEAPDDTGRPYLLYTYGLDGEDNEGLMLPGGDAAWERHRRKWPIFGGLEPGDSIGYDYILNEARPPYEEP